MKQYYTEKTLDELMKHFVILSDTREQTNHDVLDWFDSHDIRHKSKKLKTGDYSFYIEKCPELGFLVDTYFTDEICIERKNSVNELAQNFSDSSKDDNRIFKELNRMINIEKNYILIENDKLEDILYGNYKSNLNSLSFLRSILTWQSRNNMHIYFVQHENMGKMIYELCKNCLDQKILK